MSKPNDDNVAFAAEFPLATREQWLRLVEASLKGDPYERLVSRTYDGLSLQPLYSRRPNAEPIESRPPASPWQVMQRIDLPDPAAANAQALDELENGATALSLVSTGSIGARGFGFKGDEKSLSRLLEGVHLDAGISIELDASPQAKETASDLSRILARAGVSPAAADVRFGLDPIGAMAVAGGSPLTWSETAPQLSQFISRLADEGFRGPFAVADIRPVHEAGGSEAQELAFALSHALAYLRTLEAGGIALQKARRMIFFRLAADSDQFLTMAKFRALRLLWARVEAACGVAPEPTFISAETAWRMMTRRDAYVNMLRTTIAAFSAGLAGANAVSVLPFTSALGLSDGFARRIARNSQLILLEESNLARVADPAAGTGAIEDLTEKLCHAAWSLFQEIEAAGGMPAALENGFFQKKVGLVRAERQKAVALRRDALTGTSDFPHLHEVPATVLAPIKSTPLGKDKPKVKFTPLLSKRLAEPYEALRDASDQVLKKSGARPKVFLATLGKPSDFVARATFAKNFFEAGGLEAINGHEFHNSDELAAALKASGAQLACLCSSNEVYAREAAAAATALKKAGARHIYLAGQRSDSLQKAGAESFIHSGVNVLATLEAAHDILGLK